MASCPCTMSSYSMTLAVLGARHHYSQCSALSCFHNSIHASSVHDLGKTVKRVTYERKMLHYLFLARMKCSEASYYVDIHK